MNSTSSFGGQLTYCELTKFYQKVTVVLLDILIPFQAQLLYVALHWDSSEISMFIRCFNTSSYAHSVVTTVGEFVSQSVCIIAAVHHSYSGCAKKDPRLSCHTSVAQRPTAFKFNPILWVLVDYCANFYWICAAQFQMVTILILAGQYCTILGRMINLIMIN